MRWVGWWVGDWETDLLDGEHKLCLAVVLAASAVLAVDEEGDHLYVWGGGWGGEVR